jgi:hypothetical protein
MLEEETGFYLSPPASHALPQDDQRSRTIRATGAAMILSKKCETHNPLSVDSEKSRHPSSNVVQAPKASRSEITPGGRQATRLTFLEDFSIEHSVRGLRITTIEIAGIF